MTRTEIEDTLQMMLNLTEGDHRKVRRSILTRLASEQGDPSPYYNERLDSYYQLLDALRVSEGI